MKRLAVSLACLLPLSGCGLFDGAGEAVIPPMCEDQVYADPLVRDMIMKGAGSDYYANNHIDQMKAAKQDATQRCLQQKGLARPGGGVERQRRNG